MRGGVDVSGLRAQVSDFATARTADLADAWVETVRSKMPRRSGRLAASCHVDSFSIGPSGATARITVDAPYAVYVNDGTGIYGPDGQPIYPTSAKALAFDWPGGAVAFGGRVGTKSGGTKAGKRPGKGGGGLVFFAHVRGMQPTHYWERAIEEWPSVVRSLS